MRGLKITQRFFGEQKNRLRYVALRFTCRRNAWVNDTTTKWGGRGAENAGVENAAPSSKGGKRGSGKRGTK